MSLLRPEIAAALRQRGEAIAAGLVLALGVWLLWRGYQRVAPLAFATGMALGLAGLGLLLGALRRMRLRAPGPGPGLVQLDEGRIGYLGPLGGTFLDRDALIRVEFVLRAGNPLWRLSAEDGTVAEIPLGALGAAALPDAFAALPGFDDEAAVAALARGRPDAVTVWRRA